MNVSNAILVYESIELSDYLLQCTQQFRTVRTVYQLLLLILIIKKLAVLITVYLYKNQSVIWPIGFLV